MFGTNGADNAGKTDSRCLGINVQTAKVLNVGVDHGFLLRFRIL